MADHGYRKDGRGLDGGIGCICPEDFEHDGPCQNLLRGKKEAKCIPCSHGWHFPYPCNGYQPKGMLTVNTTCGTCGWDSAEHADVQERYRELTVDSRVKRRDGFYPSQHT